MISICSAKFVIQLRRLVNIKVVEELDFHDIDVGALLKREDLQGLHGLRNHVEYAEANGRSFQHWSWTELVCTCFISVRWRSHIRPILKMSQIGLEQP